MFWAKSEEDKQKEEQARIEAERLELLRKANELSQREKAVTAFKSPSQLASRLSAPRSPLGASFNSGGASVSPSVHRTQSNVSTDEANLFDDIAQSTSVVIKVRSPKNKDRTAQQAVGANETVQAAERSGIAPPELNEKRAPYKITSPFETSAAHNSAVMRALQLDINTVLDGHEGGVRTQPLSPGSPSIQVPQPGEKPVNQDTVTKALSLADQALASATNLMARNSDPPGVQAILSKDSGELVVKESHPPAGTNRGTKVESNSDVSSMTKSIPGVARAVATATATGAATTRAPVPAKATARTQVAPTAAVTGGRAAVARASTGTSSNASRELDLMHNDDSFHVIANVVVDRFKSQLESGAPTFVLSADDRAVLDRLVPPRVRNNLVGAVRERAKYCPPGSQTPIHVLVSKCVKLGLDKDGGSNPLHALTNTVIHIKVDEHSKVKVEPKEEQEPEDITSGFSIEEQNQLLRAQLEEQEKLLKERQEFGAQGSVSASMSYDGPEPRAMGSASYAARDIHVDSNAATLARQQLMSELREASNLMAESVTPEAAQFWRNHVVELQARLRALHGDLSTPVGLPPAPPPKPASPTEFGPPLPKDDYPSGQTTESRSIGQYVPPSMDASAPSEARHSKSVEFADMPTASGSISNFDPSLQSVPMVDVVAPGDLEGGYTFEAEVNGKRFLATVPAGGVKAGETFCCYMRDLETTGSESSGGKWRDSIFDFFADGICHPMVWNAFFCPLLAIGQIMTRMSLDFLGRKSKKGRNTWSTMAVITCFWFMMNLLVFGGYNYKWSRGLELSYADIGALVLVNLFMLAYTIYVVAVTRGNIRDYHMIREDRFLEMEDCCCATFCMSCAICQLGRHSSPEDDDEYQGACCTKTGLVAKNPEPATPTEPKPNDGLLV